jgi:hypothetical protein
MKMRIEDALILELCKKNKNTHFIEESLRRRNIHLKYVFRITNRHLIQPFALNELLKHLPAGKVKDTVAVAAKRAILEVTIRNQLLKREFFRVKSILEDHGIEYMLLKGLSLDFSGIRIIGDLDILVREKDLLHADKLVTNAGFSYVGDILNPLIKNNEKKDINKQLDWNNQFQYYNTEKQLLLELHTNLFERSRAHDFDLDVLLNGIDLFWNGKRWNEDLQSYVFCNEDQLILMCLHTALKRSPYANQLVLRNLLDIRALIERNIDWNRLVGTSHCLHISPFTLFSLSLARTLVGVEIPDSALRELLSHCTRAQKFLNSIHLKSFHGLDSNDILYSNIFKIFMPFVYQKKLLPRMKRILLIPVVFPNRSVMAQRFHLHKDNPLIFATYLLNPFWWIFLLGKRIWHLFR